MVVGKDPTNDIANLHVPHPQVLQTPTTLASSFACLFLCLPCENLVVFAAVLSSPNLRQTWLLSSDH
jgi:hypothetical protein